MGFKNSRYSYFKSECIKRFGADEGSRLFREADTLLNRMIAEIAPGTGKVIREHMTGTMLPTIAIYLTFKNDTLTSEKAYDTTLEIVQIAAEKVRKKNRIVSIIPFSYQLFRLMYKRVVSAQYPAEGWNIYWIRNDKQEVHFDMTSCIYMETSVRYGCPEVCPIFCANDTTNFAGYKPAILFERSSTIAKGQPLCDFHFKNGKAI